MSAPSRLVHDPDHWLLRFSVDEWLRAADVELARTRAAASAQQRRAYVAGARRAAGMALNAVLLAACHREGAMPEASSMAAYGRSYMDHVQHLRHDASEPDDVRDAAAVLLETSPDRRDLVTLSSRREPDRMLDAAERVIARSRVRIELLSSLSV